MSGEIWVRLSFFCSGRNGLPERTHHRATDPESMSGAGFAALVFGFVWVCFRAAPFGVGRS